MNANFDLLLVHIKDTYYTKANAEPNTLGGTNDGSGRLRD